jgi:phosphate transport system substrate-binding protein
MPGIREYLKEFTSDEALGDYGYLADKGLIPLPEDERAAVQAQAEALAELHLGGH